MSSALGLSAQLMAELAPFEAAAKKFDKVPEQTIEAARKLEQANRQHDAANAAAEQTKRSRTMRTMHRKKPSAPQRKPSESRQMRQPSYRTQRVQHQQKRTGVGCSTHRSVALLVDLTSNNDSG